MALKGKIQPAHINTSAYVFKIIGLVDLTFTKISGIEEKMDKAELPDRTAATGGETQPVEFTATQPAHHSVEVAAMEVWFSEGRDPVSSTYKKLATLVLTDIEGKAVRSYVVSGLWVMGRKLPDLDMSEEGTMAEIEWTFSADAILPI